MLAVVVKADQPELFTILRTLFHAWTDGEDGDDHRPAYTAPVLGRRSTNSTWPRPSGRRSHQTFGYREDTPSLRNLLMRLLVTDYAVHLHGDVPPVPRPSAPAQQRSGQCRRLSGPMAR